MMTMQRHAWHIEHRSHILHVVEIKFPDLKAACNRNFIPGVTILCKSDQYWLGFQLKGKVFDRYGTGTLSEMVNLITASFKRILAIWHRFDVGFSNGAESSSKDPSRIRLTIHHVNKCEFAKWNWYTFLCLNFLKSTKSELDPEITKKANASAGDVGGVHLYWPIDIDWGPKQFASKKTTDFFLKRNKNNHTKEI